jgi:TolB protein
MDPDGSNPRQLTGVPGRDAHATWSPDGSRIVFQSPRGAENPLRVQIYTMASDGSDVVRLTDTDAFNGVPVYSPDGRQIAFQARPTEGFEAANWDLMIMDTDGGNARVLLGGPANDQVPSWSPDGARIVFYSDRGGENHLWTMARDGTDLRQLTEGPAHAPSWSPDGSWIAFRQGQGDGNPGDVWVIRPDGSGARRVTEGTPANGVPSWSPDARSVVIEAVTDEGPDVYAVDVETGAPRRLSRSVDGERWRSRTESGP